MRSVSLLNFFLFYPRLSLSFAVFFSLMSSDLVPQHKSPSLALGHVCLCSTFFVRSDTLKSFSRRQRKIFLSKIYRLRNLVEKKSEKIKCPLNLWLCWIFWNNVQKSKGWNPIGNLSHHDADVRLYPFVCTRPNEALNLCCHLISVKNHHESIIKKWERYERVSRVLTIQGKNGGVSDSCGVLTYSIISTVNTWIHIHADI